MNLIIRHPAPTGEIWARAITRADARPAPYQDRYLAASIKESLTARAPLTGHDSFHYRLDSLPYFASRWHGFSLGERASEPLGRAGQRIMKWGRMSCPLRHCFGA